MAIIGYTEEADFAAYAAARGITLSASESVLLTKSFDWVELQKYQGSKTDTAQPNQWPRKDVYIDNVLQDSATVPELVKELQMRIAIDIDQGSDPNGVVAQGVKSETVVGAVSVTYQDNTSQSVISSQAQALLSKLAGSGSKWEFGRVRG